jgi:hypothetical protein
MPGGWKSCHSVWALFDFVCCYIFFRDPYSTRRWLTHLFTLHSFVGKTAADTSISGTQTISLDLFFQMIDFFASFHR